MGRSGIEAFLGPLEQGAEWVEEPAELMVAAALLHLGSSHGEETLRAALRSGELLDKGFDLGKYLVANGVIKAPFAKLFLSQAMRWAR